MTGFLDGLFSTIAALFCLLLAILFCVLKGIGVLVVSWWFVLLPILLFFMFIVIGSRPGAP